MKFDLNTILSSNPHLLQVFESIPTILKMEQAEEVVEDKLCTLRYRMRMYPVSPLFSGNMDQHDDKIDKREQMLEDLLLSFRNLIRKFPSLLAQEKTIELQNQITAMEQEFLVYKDSFHSKITELKSSLIPSMHNLSLSDSFKVEQMQQ